ncbi:hypothetical protein [Castellaniella sp.]|uniref:hypothetical protein n=1 Tax=Castellaniella sp. TaxID=1955812 RepID=UPI002AFEF316|nr:hypothetical protein [Castellaniella sp.]
MHIVISGAWPDPEVAAELAPHLAQRAPTLARWLSRSKAVPTSSPAAETWCTPLEHWQLQARGFVAAQAEHISAGLGPLRGDAHDDDPVWLAELIHMAPSRDGAALLPAATLGITAEHSAALLDTAREYLDDSGLQLESLRPDTWRVRWPDAVDLACASPALVATSAVNDWWPQDSVARPWRRLANTLQMAWFDHPVNHARQEAGLPPINSLWLYGGARTSQLTRPQPADLHIDTTLQDAAITQNWGDWIEALAVLDQERFAPLAQTQPTLVLTGRDRYVTLTAQGGWLARLRAQDWRRWWCNR